MGDMEREMNELEPLKASIRERIKGLKTKRRIFLVQHGEWVDVTTVSEKAKIHKTTALRELHNLRAAGLMEAEKRGRVYFFRAIKPADAEITLEMFMTTRQIDAFHKEVEEAKLRDTPIPDHSWMPPIVCQWGGYRVAMMDIAA